MSKSVVKNDRVVRSVYFVIGVCQVAYIALVAYVVVKIAAVM